MRVSAGVRETGARDAFVLRAVGWLVMALEP